MDYIPTRMTKVSTPKPAANPLQFVKVGPCDLFKSAQETLKKVEEVKKMKREVRDEAEEWQSNLDNWKCSRRKRVEHIIDRVVEVKKFELEEHERNRRKAKTFSEMMEERTSKGRKMSLLIHKDDDSNDLSDLGIGTSSDKSSVSEDYANDDNHSTDDGDVSVKNNYHEQNGSSETNGKSSNTAANEHDDETSTNTTVSSPEPEEYTYDRAIQGYVNFTETRVKSRSVRLISRTESESTEETFIESSSKVSPQKLSPNPAPKPRKDSKKVEEDIADIERIQSRKFSGSSSDLHNPEKKLNVPKVDILKRKELFERSDSNEQSKVASRAAGDLVNSQSIRDRVSNLERQKSEENGDKSKLVKQLPSEISVKDRLSLLERQKSSDNQTKSCSSSKLNALVIPGDATAPAPPSIKDRLSSLEQVASGDRSSKICSEVTPTSIKDRLSELGAPKEIPKKFTPDRDPSFRNKLANFRSTEQDLNSEEVSKPTNNSVVDSSARFLSPDEEEFYRKRTFHRSLDSLDVDSSSVMSNEPYERVQSLEDLDSCGPSRNYPASASSNENLVLSSHSGDTDREDSGIHTADVSCSVSQADEPADFGDINVPCSNMHIENGVTYVGESERNMEYAPPTIVSQLAKINLTESVPLEKVSSHPEVVSLETICPSHSQVLVDSPNLYSSSKSSVAVSKTYSGQHSSLPTIPEISNDCPPVVYVFDTESVTPAYCTEAALSPIVTLSPLEAESISECTDKTELGNLISQAMVVAPNKVVEGENVALPERTCMPSHCPDDVFNSCEDNTSSLFGGSSAAAGCLIVEQSGLHTETEDEKDVMDVSVMVVTEDSDARPSIDKGPKPYSLSSKDPESIMERDFSSVTSGETDADVSSFLDQALLEEDLKMEAPCINESQIQQQQDLLHSVPKNEICPIMQSNEINVLPLAFPLGTSSSAEPPKEKPPPPPVELSDDEDKPDEHNNASNILSNNNQKPNLGRLDSTKRIKKDIRRKRSDFLGIEGNNDDSYLECELKVAPPPDMTSFLQEERRLEQELYRQMQPTLYPESDHGSNQGESRDSGVELDNHLHSHNLHLDYAHEVQSSENHSRQNSELFGNASSTSEEDEIIKKEREIIEILEKEEQWRYGTNTILSPSDHHQVGEKLAAKLRELEREKMQLEWERAEESRKVAAEQAACQEEQRRIRMKEQQLRQQESRLPADVPFDCDPSDMTPEALQGERERLKQEQAELERQREILAANQVNGRQSWDSMSSSTAHRSLQDVSGSPLVGSHCELNVPPSNAPLNYRLSLPDLQQSDLNAHAMGTHPHRPPPPIPPAKPLSAVSQERHSVNSHSRQGQSQSSSDSLALSSESQHHRHNSVGLPSVPMAASPTSSTGSQQMTRQTLHALSAAPRSKIIATDTWVQAKRKPESQRNNNRDHYQHWLIQEAEQRRITEQHQRNAVSRKSLPPNLTQNQHLQPKPTAQSVQPQVPQAWQYHHPSHQHAMHQIQHQHPHHSNPVPLPHPHAQHSHITMQTSAPPVPPPPRQEKPLPDAIIQTLTQRVQNRASMNENNRRLDNSPARESRSTNQVATNNINNNNMSNININLSHTNGSYAANSQEKMLSVSGKKKCSHCNEELGRGAAMIIESLRLFYHMDCFKCCVCHVQLGDGLMGTDVRVRNHKLHCHNCYSSDDGVKFSCV